MKENYQRAAATMSELLMLENERAQLAAPMEYDELLA